jgi:arsenite-transporting ATPase
MDEIFGLVRVFRHHKDGHYDVLIIDSAPTGTALRLLSIPEVAGWYMRRFYKPLEKVAVYLRPLVEPVFRPLAGFSLPDKAMMDLPYEFYEQIDSLGKILTDNSVTSVRLVTNPERMVIKESLRAQAYLSLYNISIDLVVANRIIPDEVTDPYFQYWKENQKLYRQEIIDSFSPLPIKEVPLYSREICGLATLEKLKELLYGEEDPSQVYYRQSPYQIKQVERGYNLELHLPGLPDEKIQLSKSGDELNIRIGNHRRNMVLPQALATLRTTGAEKSGDKIIIGFSEDRG